MHILCIILSQLNLFRRPAYMLTELLLVFLLSFRNSFVILFVRLRSDANRLNFITELLYNTSTYIYT